VQGRGTRPGRDKEPGGRILEEPGRDHPRPGYRLLISKDSVRQASLGNKIYTYVGNQRL